MRMSYRPRRQDVVEFQRPNSERSMPQFGLRHSAFFGHRISDLGIIPIETYVTGGKNSTHDWRLLCMVSPPLPYGLRAEPDQGKQAKRNGAVARHFMLGISVLRPVRSRPASLDNPDRVW
jgi:hypothetical protein